MDPTMTDEQQPELPIEWWSDEELAEVLAEWIKLLKKDT